MLTLEDISDGATGALVEFCYLGHVHAQKIEVLVELWELTPRFNVRGLVAALESAILKLAKPSNVLLVLAHVSSIVDVKECSLAKQLLSYVVENYSKVSANPSFQNPNILTRDLLLYITHHACTQQQ